MRALAQFILFAVICISSNEGMSWERSSEARSGEMVNLAWEYPLEAELTPEGNRIIDKWVLSRRSSSSANPMSPIGSETKVWEGLPSERQVFFKFPTGTTARYWYVLRPISIDGEAGPGIEFLLRRVK